jgi:hypothetical protein
MKRMLFRLLSCALLLPSLIHARLGTSSSSAPNQAAGSCASKSGFCHRKLLEYPQDVEIIPNEYLIKFKKSHDDHVRTKMQRLLKQLPADSTAKIMFVYHLTLNAVAIINVSDDDLKVILDDPDVVFAERVRHLVDSLRQQETLCTNHMCNTGVWLFSILFLILFLVLFRF